MNKIKLDDFDKDMVRRCRDSEFALGYLNEILLDKSPHLQERLLLGLRHVARAYGIQRLAKKIGRSRETLYVILSKKGNPSLDTLLSILGSFGMRPVLVVATEQKQRRVTQKRAA